MRKRMIYIILTVFAFFLIAFLFFVFIKDNDSEDTNEPEAIPYPTGVIAESYFIKDTNIIYFQRGNKIFEYNIKNDEIRRIQYFEIEDLGQIYFKVRLGGDRFCVCYNFKIQSPDETATVLNIFDYEGKLIEKKTTNLTLSPLECSEELVMETSLPLLKHKLYRWNDEEPVEVDENDEKIGKTKNGEQIEIGTSNIKDLIPNIKDYAEIIGHKNLMVLKDFRGELWILNLEN